MNQDTELVNQPEEHLEWTNWKDQPKDSFIYNVMSGRQGAFAGLYNGLDRVSKYISGTQRGRYYLMSADSGGGKTTIADFMFVINAWLDAKAKGRKIKIYYCSFEVSEQDKNAKWCAWYIYWKYGKSIPTNYILGRIEGNHLKEDELPMITEAWNFVKEMKKDIKVIEETVNPTAIFEGLVDHYAKYGTVERRQSDDDKKKGRKGKVVGYKPLEEIETILFIDHLKLVNSELGLDMKRTMDKMSRYCVILKNLFGTTAVVLQQFNTDLLASRRDAVNQKKNNATVEIEPNRKDLGDSSSSFQDSCVVLGLVMPRSYNLDEFRKYNTSYTGLGSFMVAMYIMKNKYGEANVMCPLFMNPVAGYIYDLPSPENSFEMEKWVDRATNLRSELERFVPVHKTE